MNMPNPAGPYVCARGRISLTYERTDAIPAALFVDFSRTAALIFLFDLSYGPDQLRKMPAGFLFLTFVTIAATGHDVATGAVGEADGCARVFVAEIGHHSVALAVEFYIREIQHTGSRRIMQWPRIF